MAQSEKKKHREKMMTQQDLNICCLNQTYCHLSIILYFIIIFINSIEFNTVQLTDKWLTLQKIFSQFCAFMGASSSLIKAQMKSI